MDEVWKEGMYLGLEVRNIRLGPDEHLQLHVADSKDLLSCHSVALIFPSKARAITVLTQLLATMEELDE